MSVLECRISEYSCLGIARIWELKHSRITRGIAFHLRVPTHDTVPVPSVFVEINHKHSSPHHVSSCLCPNLVDRKEAGRGGRSSRAVRGRTAEASRDCLFFPPSPAICPLLASLYILWQGWFLLVFPWCSDNGPPWLGSSRAIQGFFTMGLFSGSFKFLMGMGCGVYVAQNYNVPNVKKLFNTYVFLAKHLEETYRKPKKED